MHLPFDVCISIGGFSAAQRQTGQADIALETKQLVAPGLIDSVRRHYTGIAAKFAFVGPYSGFEVIFLIEITPVARRQLDVAQLLADSRYSRHWLSRTMSAKYLMSAGATVASRSSFSRFFFQRSLFFFDVFWFAFLFCLDGFVSLFSSLKCKAGGLSPSSAASFRSTFLHGRVKQRLRMKLVQSLKLLHISVFLELLYYFIVCYATNSLMKITPKAIREEVAGHNVPSLSFLRTPFRCIPMA